jgi:hypothetical protein
MLRGLAHLSFFRSDRRRPQWPGVVAMAAACGAVGLAATACSRRDPGEPLALVRETNVAAPIHDPADGPCSDVGARRVCWSPSCDGNLCIQARLLPTVIADRPREYRCSGRGEARSCARRSTRAPEFQCHRGHCVQEQPRLPDDGEWECTDVAGIALCRGGGAAAGVASPAREFGWICGARRAGRRGEPICLDLDPDLPPDGLDYDCRYETQGARLRRICERSDAPYIGGACSAEQRCPAGSRCGDGVCVPRSVTANCWADLDCGLGQCLYGSCSEPSP